MSQVLERIQQDFPSLKVVDQTMTYNSVNDEFVSNPNVLIVAQKSDATQIVFSRAEIQHASLLLEYLGQLFVVQEYLKIIIEKWIDQVVNHDVVCNICTSEIVADAHTCKTCGEQICPDCKLNYIITKYDFSDLQMSSSQIVDDVLIHCPFCNHRGTGSGFI
eukprot:Lithocolla_globosa_v1_NODE_10141_length_630_cov_208.666087.p1 type:complete len:162 gc:universal NODE_10141_length_630_cov_208.666087:558-73(-)